jgi:hypothetical protein
VTDPLSKSWRKIIVVRPEWQGTRFFSGMVLRFPKGYSKTMTEVHEAKRGRAPFAFTGFSPAYFTGARTNAMMP